MQFPMNLARSLSDLGVRREGKRDRDQNLRKSEAHSGLFNEDSREFWPISAFPQQNRPKSDRLLVLHPCDKFGCIESRMHSHAGEAMKVFVVESFPAWNTARGQCSRQTHALVVRAYSTLQDP